MKTPDENAPTFGRSRGAKNTILAGLHHHSNANVDILLNRLEGVRQYGQGWRARCPAHEGKSTGSLSIAQGDDDRILLHCFGGCDVLTILNVCGLEIGDLFPKRISHCTTPAERRQLQELARQSQYKAAIPLLCTEGLVIHMAGIQISKGIPLSKDDDKRLQLALERVETAWGVFCGR